MPGEGPPWLNEAIVLRAVGLEEKALDIIYDNVDDLLLAGKLEEVDSLLSTFPVFCVPTDFLVGMLTITLRESERLKHRSEFFQRVKEVISLRGELEYGLLEGLDPSYPWQKEK